MTGGRRKIRDEELHNLYVSHINYYNVKLNENEMGGAFKKHGCGEKCVREKTSDNLGLCWSILLQ